MASRKRALGVAAAVAVGATALPSSASAVPVSCVFSGVVGNMTPGVMLAGGSGTYDMQTDDTVTRCGTGGVNVLPSRITSRGTFVNVVCGTMSLAAPASQTTVTIGGVPFSMRYTIDLKGFQGTIDVQSFGGSPDPLPVNGHVTMIPLDGTCGVGSAVNAFGIRGWFQTV